MTLDVHLSAHHALLPGPLLKDHDAVALRRLGDALAERLPGMDRYSRLDRYGRALAKVCAEAATSAGSLPLESGLSVASLHSCEETNAQFDLELIAKGPRTVSPLLFPYTLPGAAAAEAAMHLRLGGPYRVYPGGADAALVALLTAAEGISEGEMPACIVATSDVVGEHTLRHLTHGRSLPGPSEPPLAEAACALVLRQASDASRGPMLAFEAALGPGDPHEPELERTAHEALERAGVQAHEIEQVISVTTRPELAEHERRVTEKITRNAERLSLPWRLGNAGASLGLFALLAATEGQGPALVLATSGNGTVTLVLAECSLW